MKPSTIALIGVGTVGSTAAYTISLAQCAAEILLIDCNTKKCIGELSDLQDAFQQAYQALRQASYKEAAQADIIIICAGRNQKPSEPRTNLYAYNVSIIDSIINELTPLNNNAILIIVTNPTDLLSLHVHQKNILPKHQVFGSGTWLDTQRLQRFLAKEYAIPTSLAQPYVLGEHGDSSYIVWPKTYPYASLTEEQKNAALQFTRDEVYKIIDAKGATAYGIASCIRDYCISILLDQNLVFPISVYDEKEDLSYNQLAMLGSNGITGIIPLPHDFKEKQQQEHSLATLKSHKEEKKY